MFGAMSANSEFNQFYEEQWGGRWPALFGALQQPGKKVVRWNVFSELPKPDRLKALPAPFSNCYELESLPENWLVQIPRGPDGLLAFYVMDPGSYLIARALNVQAGDQVLDMCAAPGGKSLVLIEALQGKGEIVLNEISQTRRERLKKVIQQYVPRSVRENVRISGKDGGLFAKTHSEHFNRILVDAPCSGERHLLESQKHLAAWSPSQSKQLSQRQYALVTGAIEAVGDAGSIVFSTCSLSKLENDFVVNRVLNKKADRVKLVQSSISPDGAERTEFGYQWLPDQSGYGPLYFAMLNKS